MFKRATCGPEDRDKNFGLGVKGLGCRVEDADGVEG